MKTHEMDIELFNQWVSERPKLIQEMIKKHPPNLLYSLKGGNQRVTIYSYDEDGTVKVNVNGKYNLIMFGRTVFGVDPEDLTECDLPSKDEKLGCILHGAEANEYIENLRKEKVKSDEN